MMILSICGASIILAVVAFCLRTAKSNPVEKRVNRSLQRTLDEGVPTTLQLAPKGYKRGDLLRRKARKASRLSSPAWA